MQRGRLIFRASTTLRFPQSSLVYTTASCRGRSLAPQASGNAGRAIDSATVSRKPSLSRSLQWWDEDPERGGQQALVLEAVQRGQPHALARALVAPSVVSSGAGVPFIGLPRKFAASLTLPPPLHIPMHTFSRRLRSVFGMARVGLARIAADVSPELARATI